MKAVLYSRISDDRDGSGAGVQRQHDDLIAMADREGWEIVGDFTDNDISATHGAKRQGWEQALELVGDGAVDILAAWASDRLTRHPRELEDLVDLLEVTETRVVTVTSGEYDLVTPEGRAVARIIGAIARQESERKSVRQKRRHLQDLENGVVRRRGTRPFGYTAEMEIVDEEAAWVRRIYEAVADGTPISGAQQMLNDAGVPTSTGRPWSKTTTRRVLTAPRYRAVLTHGNDEVGPAPWPAIVDDALWHRTQAAVRRRSNPKVRADRKYLLTGGIAVCGRCGAPLVARPRGDGRRSYICPPAKWYPDLGGCSRIRILGDPFEEYVSEQVIAAFDTTQLQSEIAAATAETDAIEVAADIRELENRLDELASDYYADRRLTRSQFDAAHNVLSERLEAARSSLAPTPPLPRALSDLGTLEGWWPSASIEERRQIIRLVISTVVVNPAVKGRNRFDPDRIAFSPLEASETPPE